MSTDLTKVGFKPLEAEVKDLEDLFVTEKTVKIGNIEIKIRSVTMQDISKFAAGKERATEEYVLQLLKAGIIEPKELKDNVEKLKGGFARKLLMEIMALSGLTEEATEKAKGFL